MTGPEGSILGVTPTAVIEKMRTHMPRRFTVAEGEIRAHGVLFDIDAAAGKTRKVERIVF
jgi:calcineurin-like phosphoesterase